MKLAFALVLVALCTRPQFAMADVATLPKPEGLPVVKELPDPLVCMDGTRVTTREQWLKQRRPELKRLFQHYMYGYFPLPQKIAATVERRRDDYFGGKATKKEVTIRFGPEGTPPIHLLLVTPKSNRPVPVFVGLNFSGNHAVLADPDVALPTVWMRDNRKGVVNNKATDDARGAEKDVWNVEYVVEHGYGVATFYHGDVDPDKDDPTDGMPAAFRKAGLIEDGEDACATLAAWAYGIHRAVDYLEQDTSVDRNRIAVVGHSRNGKAALVAGAFDPRIALVIPLQAGCGGTSPSRGTVGESVKAINDHFPHWFDATFKKFNEQPQRLPFDQHCLIALCAPRPVLLPNAVEDQWANPAGQFEMLKAAEPVYKLLGAEGCAAEKMPETGQLVDSTLGYWIRPGKHSMTKDDWEVFLRYADKHFRTGHARAD